jgi:hypothetical protein
MTRLETVSENEPPFNVFNDEYSRQRYDPRPGDKAYLHLVDLQRALRPRLARARGTWLDFGAASSPYRRFISGAELRLGDSRLQAQRHNQPLRRA